MSAAARRAMVVCMSVVLLSACMMFLGGPEVFTVPVVLGGHNVDDGNVHGWQGYITVNPMPPARALQGRSYDVEVTWGAALQNLADNGLVHRITLRNVPENTQTDLPFLTYVSAEPVSIHAYVIDGKIRVGSSDYIWTGSTEP